MKHISQILPEYWKNKQKQLKINGAVTGRKKQKIVQAYKKRENKIISKGP